VQNAYITMITYIQPTYSFLSCLRRMQHCS